MALRAMTRSSPLVGTYTQRNREPQTPTGKRTEQEPKIAGGTRVLRIHGDLHCAAYAYATVLNAARGCVFYP
jgi:hypothetical protein